MKKLILLGLLACSLSFGQITRPSAPNFSVVNSDMTGTLISTIDAPAFVATAGNLIAVSVSTFNTTTHPTTTPITDTAGNAYTFVTSTGNDTSSYIAWYYAKNIIGHATNVVRATLTGTAQYVVIHVLQYGGLDQIAPLDSQPPNTPRGDTVAFNTTITTGTYDTAVANELILVSGRHTGGITAGVIGGLSATIRAVDTDGFHATEDLILSSLRTGINGTMTSPTANSWESVTVAFKAAAAATAGPKISIDFK